MVYAEERLPQEIDGTWRNAHEEAMTKFIGLGGMATIILKNNKPINLQDTCIAFENETVSGKDAEGYNIYNKHKLPTLVYSFSEIKEIITEGLIFNENNKMNANKFLNETEINFIKIPKRKEEDYFY